MHEILFRGKTKFGDWNFGDYSKRNGNTYITEYMGGYSYSNKVIPETVGQYTGLTDKNGTKIFEGDIVQTLKPLSCGECPNKLCIIDIRTTSTFAWSIIGQSEVVGNIHDNLELLKGD